MPLVAPLLSALLAVAVIAGMAVTTRNWSQQRSAALYAEIDADIRKTLSQYDARKAELAASELRAPPSTTGTAAAVADDDSRTRKAQNNSLRKRAAGARRERLVPPDFARLPISVMRGALGIWR
jgi:hypothetical protein